MKHAVLFPAVALSLAACQDPIQPEVRGLASPPMFSTTSSTGIPVTDLGTLGGTFSQASGINELGQVVGTSTTDTEPDALVRARAFLWTEQGGMIDLGTLGGVSEGGAINNRGQVVGSSLNASDTRHAFFWDRATGMIDLGSLAGPLGISRATAINEHGQVVGESDVVLNNGLRHAFLWTKEGGMIDLGTGGGVEGQATISTS